MPEGLKRTLSKVKRVFPARPVGSPTVRCRSASQGPVGGGKPAPRRRRRARSPLQSPRVRAAMRRAWRDSQPNSAKHRHEEGGYIVRNRNGTYDVIRWPRGAGASIRVPPLHSGAYRGWEIVGAFHTHPNPAVDERGRHWQESPSPGDIKLAKAQHLPGNHYVVGHDNVWRTGNTGQVSKVGPRGRVLRR